MQHESQKNRLLKSHLNELKREKTHCEQCNKVLDRSTLVFRGRIISKLDIAQGRLEINDQVWDEIREEVQVLCRFCGEVSCKVNVTYFDIVDFKQYLVKHTRVSFSTVREYVVRLRRLDERLRAAELPPESVKGEAIMLDALNYLPDCDTAPNRIALRKFEQYLHWKQNNTAA